MPFNIPDHDSLKQFSVAGITDLANIAHTETTELRASVTGETVTDEQLERIEALVAFGQAAENELVERKEKTSRFDATAPKTVVAGVDADTETDTAPEPEFNADGVKNVAATTTAVDVANTPTSVVEATVTAAGAVKDVQTVTLADIAPYAPTPQARIEGTGYTILAAATIATSATKLIPTGQELTWKGLGEAFVEQVRPHQGMRKGGVKGRHTQTLAMIRRDYPDDAVLVPGDSDEQAYLKLARLAGKDDEVSRLAANGWCAPSEPDLSICSPITADGLWSGPEAVLRRGGKIHNQGLDFGDFFGNDFALPIPGFNILTEAQVISDTAKTCVEIPCPAFVDDRLNVAALCLTGSLLQNRGYPEFVSTFTEGAVMAMAHLVNREVVNEIETGSVAVNLSAVDPWGTDGTVWSQVMSAFDFAAMDLRYVYRSLRTQVMEVVAPYWLKQALRADWLRRNATHTEDLADAMIDAALARRYVRVQWIYDWQDAFDPTNGAGAIPATNQMGAATPAFNVPTNLTFLIYLPGTWLLGRQDVIRLDSVYDSTNLQQNLVTQLFMEDGFRPMRMCQHSRAYTVTVCASGATASQRAVACTDVTP